MGQKRNTTIRFHLTKLVLACVIPVWLAAGYLVASGYAAKCKYVNQGMLESARFLAEALDSQLTSVQAALLSLSTSPNFAAGDLAGVHRQALQLLQSFPDSDIIVADATGQQVVNTFRPSGAPLPKRKNPNTVRRVFATGKPVIGDLFLGAVTKRPLVSVDVPVLIGGQVAYDLALTFPADRLADIVAAKLPEGGRYLSILDGRQQLVARSLLPSLVGRSAPPQLKEALLRSREGTVEIDRNLEGKAVFASFCRSSVCDWSVVAGAPKEEFRRDLFQWLAWAIIGVLGISLFGVILALRLGRPIADSIRSLVAPALNLGGGVEVESPPESHLVAETDEVARALVDAARLLRERDQELLITERRYQGLFANRSFAVLHCRVVVDGAGEPVDFEILQANDAFERLFKLPHEPGSCRRLNETIPALHDFGFEPGGKLGALALKGGELQVEGQLGQTGRYYGVYCYSPLPGEVTATFTETTDRKRLELFKELGRDIGQLLSSPGDLHGQMRQVVLALRERGEFAAVGLRLRDGDDFPYFEQVGLSEEFLNAEAFLTLTGPELAASGGRPPVLACTCGQVVAEKLDAGRPNVTVGGSYWNNDLQLSSEVEQLCRPQSAQWQQRSGCLREGFASVALVPIRSAGVTHGLLQLFSQQRNRFNRELVEELERIAFDLGAFLTRRKMS